MCDCTILPDNSTGRMQHWCRFFVDITKDCGLPWRELQLGKYLRYSPSLFTSAKASGWGCYYWIIHNKEDRTDSLSQRNLKLKTISQSSDDLKMFSWLFCFILQSFEWAIDFQKINKIDLQGPKDPRPGWFDALCVPQNKSKHTVKR